jgi:surface antigen
MARHVTLLLAGTLGLVAAWADAPAQASGLGYERRADYDSIDDADPARLPGYLQCVPYARKISGVNIRGDAWTWWGQAEGRYARGSRPRVGAVMAFRPYGRMQLGHVAAVSRIIDSRTVLLRHANWSPINGRRGQVEDDVMAVDSSPGNDWSEVRVWFDPIRGLGSTRWPLAGFIYNKPPGRSRHMLPRGGFGSDPIGEIIAAYSR